MELKAGRYTVACETSQGVRAMDVTLRKDGTLTFVEDDQAHRRRDHFPAEYAGWQWRPRS